MYYTTIFSEKANGRVEYFVYFPCRLTPYGENQAAFELLDAVLLVELINAAAGVNELLLAGVEGMALGADFNCDALTGGAGLDGCAASALDNGGLIIGMDACFHCFFSSFIGCLDYAMHGYKTQSEL